MDSRLDHGADPHDGDDRVPAGLEPIVWYATICLCLTGIACSSDSGGDDPNCGPNETYNKISGLCEPSGRDPGDSPDAGDFSDTSADGSTLPSEPDSGVDPTCNPRVDSDQDGLSNKCECERNLESNDPDTDDDGAPDGRELGGDCSFDPSQGDTDPTNPDTDGDGLDDGTERNGPTDPLEPDTDGDGLDDGTEANICTKPTESDTDSDGLSDGTEDPTGDGQIGECTSGYSPDCANGESDPCSADTDGDGTPDGEELAFRQCQQSDTNALSTPTSISSTSGNYKLAVASNVNSGAVSASGASQDAHTFIDTNQHYTGFVVEYDVGNSGAEQAADDLASTVQSAFSQAGRRSTGTKLQTHDFHPAIVQGRIGLNNSPAPSSARDNILAELLGTSRSSLSHSLQGQTLSGPSGGPTLFVYELVKRKNSSSAVVVGALASREAYRDTSAKTGIRIDDLTGGASLAEAGQPLQPECVSFDVQKSSKVDIILSVDGSGSMSDERSALSNFASSFTDLLDRANLDWRIGVTTVNCAGIASASAISSDLRQVFKNAGAATGGLIDTGWCASTSSSGLNNGQLLGAGFTNNPVQVATHIQNIPNGASEYTMSMGLAALDRALPRQSGSSTRIRPDASVIIIGITDERDEFFEESVGIQDATKSISSSQRTQVINQAGPLLNWLDGAASDATLFGLYAPPGETCSSAREYAVGISHMVSETGGNGGSVCQADVTNTLRSIADAASGLGSSLRLLGVPAPQTLTVKHVDMMPGQIVDLPRSRQDGFDYASIVNRISLVGPDPPAVGDRLIVPYLRWKGSRKECTKGGDQCSDKETCISGFCR